MFFFHGYSMLSPNILSGVLESIKIDKNFIWSLLKLEKKRLQKYYIEKAKARAGALTHELVLYGFFMATL